MLKLQGGTGSYASCNAVAMQVGVGVEVKPTRVGVRVQGQKQEEILRCLKRYYENDNIQFKAGSFDHSLEASRFSPYVPPCRAVLS